MLGGALSAAGVPLWQPPASLETLDELKAAIAPMRLPPDVEEFWRRVDPDTVRASPYPRFTGPEFALTGWLNAREEFRAM